MPKNVCCRTFKISAVLLVYPLLFLIFYAKPPFLVPSACRAEDFDISPGVYFFGGYEQNLIDPYLRVDLEQKRFRLDLYNSPTFSQSYPGFWAFARGGWIPVKWFSFGFLIDTGVYVWRWEPKTKKTLAGEIPTVENARAHTLDGLNPQDFWSKWGFVRESYLIISPEQTEFTTVSLGKQRSRLVEGWVYDDYGFQASIQFDFSALDGPPFSALLGLVLPYRYWGDLGVSELILHFNSRYEFSPLEWLQCGAVWLADRGNLIANSMRQILSAYAFGKGHSKLGVVLGQVESFGPANLLWVYATLRLGVGEFLLTATGASQWGNLLLSTSMHRPTEPNNIKLRGWASVVSAIWLGVDKVALEPYVIYFSGHQDFSGFSKGDVDFSAFISLVPVLDFSDIFFSGGFQNSTATRQSSLVGLNASGVISPGLRVSIFPINEFNIRIAVSPLFSDADSPQTSQRFYGLETDVNLLWQLSSNFSLLMQNGALVTGNYFEKQGVFMAKCLIAMLWEM